MRSRQRQRIDRTPRLYCVMRPSNLTLPLLPAYYLAATPVFLLLDVGLDVSVRASFLGDFGARLAYYAFCIACGVVAWLRPARSPWIGLGESAVTITLLCV
ncbi:MAG TPA: hypothetical protein VK928_08680, partial [Longimicrobiales bacterium]|nr:hypothetical protein [Longimicrobiales bacterium]